ncbi:MAG: hypothetical protein FWF10_07050 [Clostridiales bacterium]|nr:hypothetical protein [Clostridiales bacterium]
MDTAVPDSPSPAASIPPMGALVVIDVYVNDVKVETPVYRDTNALEIAGPDNLSDFVLLAPVCEAIGASFSLQDNGIAILYSGESYFIDEILFGDPNYYISNDHVYIHFWAIRYAMNGSLKQDDYDSMYLYTADFERLDIPASLEECYAALDALLDDAFKEALRDADPNELYVYHFGLGMWIRNNWIYPSENRITKVFVDAGFEEADGMSSAIIRGYHYYLNGLPYELGDGEP